MDKVKQIFKSESHDSNSSPTTHTARESNVSNGTDSTNRTHPTGVHGSFARSSNVANTIDNSSATGTAYRHGVSHTEAEASLPGHRHNIEQHASLDGVGEKTHDHKHLAAVTKDHHHTHETEEVQRVRDVDRHVHHVQHHVQPVLDTQQKDREYRDHVHDVTHIREQHVNTDEDKKLFSGLNTHRNETTDHGKERTIVDKGEVVNENVSHHVHHIVQPVIERDTHHHSTIHTTIPVKHTTHEAPIIHQSSTHEPMNIKDFVSQGGDLKSKLTHDQAGVLAEGDCARDVTGPAETLASKLHLGSGSHSTGTSGSATTA